ncbi:Putative leucine-rich repeat receptor-like protein kinase family protein [Zea mays]|nr:Putative leucine-rich repeat receptor-like protein kinase family protein [Zea mays]
MKLTGSVPASVCALKSLTHLDLSYDNLTGDFPGAALYACAGLTFLDLSNNQFSGPLPLDIDRLSPAMEHLNLSTNSFAGEVPPAVGGFPALRSLLLDTNSFTGAYPAAEISKLTGLQMLTLADNEFAPAPVPTEFSKLTNLTYLWMGGMNLTGEIPEAFSSLKELTLFSMASNQLTGSIPAWVWQHQKLQYIYLFDNALSGELTRSVTALNLLQIDLSTNQLTGDIPEDFGNLKNLTILFLYNNQLSGTIPASIGLLPQLKDIRLFQNQLSGELPPELGKHSPLGNLEVSINNLSGPLRESLCANGKLFDIVAFNNSFSGELPAELGDCITINNLMLHNNNFSGDFPEKIWSFPNLTLVMVQNNSFTGTLPAQISPKMARIEIGNNRFSGSFPASAPALKVLHAENNRLGGELPPDMSKLANLTDLSVPGNQISGSIPTSIKLLQKLNSLDMRGNRLSSAIPPGSIGLLPALTMLDLSDNEITGNIPSDVSNVFNLLNLSSNQLTGEVPAQLQSAAYDQSFLGNRLCARADSGTNLPMCPAGCRGCHDELSKGLIILFAMLAAIVLVGSIGIAWLLFRRRKESQEVTDWKMTAFTQLNFSESDVLSNIREENVIGSGGSGKVYRIHLGNGNASHSEERGIGGDGRMVAVKRIWNSRKVDEKLDKEFESEVKVLGNIRHNNIVKLLCCISSQEAKLLVYEYMENGSLDRWLHHRDREGAPAPLDWPTRLAIAVDAAKGLSYMHHDCAPPIVHRDVKSSNILLDPDFQAKIADFGLARILVKSGEPQSVSAIGGTFGYMAPEYGYRPKVSEKVDVYSFGVVLLELTTGKVANDSGADLCLAEWAWRRYQRGPLLDDVVDEAIREPAYMQDILWVFTLGVICTGENPLTRPSMKEVLHQLIRCEQIAAEAEACQASYQGGGGGGTPLLESRKKGSRRRSMSDSGRWNDDDEEDSGNFVVHVV